MAGADSARAERRPRYAGVYMAIVEDESNERTQAAEDRQDGAAIDASPDAAGKEAGALALALANVSAQQETALRALAAGRALGEVAAEAGVDRGTLYRWRTRDPQFMAALKAWRA